MQIYCIEDRKKCNTYEVYHQFMKSWVGSVWYSYWSVFVYIISYIYDSTISLMTYALVSHVTSRHIHRSWLWNVLQYLSKTQSNYNGTRLGRGNHHIYIFDQYFWKFNCDFNTGGHCFGLYVHLNRDGFHCESQSKRSSWK